MGKSNNRMIVHKGHVLLLPEFPEEVPACLYFKYQYWWVSIKELSDLLDKGLHPKNKAKYVSIEIMTNHLLFHR